MRVQLHQADRQTVGVGIIPVVFRDALAPEVRRPRLEGQTILERGADVEELKQSGDAYADAGGSRAWQGRGPGRASGLSTNLQIPEKSGLPSGVLGTGPVRSGFPSAAFGTPAVG